LHYLAVSVNEIIDLNASHHGIRNLVGDFRPQINNLIVFFPSSDNAVIVLLLNILHIMLGPGNKLFLFFGDGETLWEL
jgi:hypothetical protein